MVSMFIDERGSDAERRQRLYRGDLFVFAPTPASTELVGLARSMLEQAFSPYDPRLADRHLDREACTAILARLKPACVHHPACKVLVRRIIAEFGGDMRGTYFDLPRLRSAYPKHYLTSGLAYAFQAHRDTWYSAPMCQINWWLPIFEILPANALSIYPRYFDDPVANSSARYDHDNWIDHGRFTAAENIYVDRREQPALEQEIDRDDIRPICPPGGLIVFSGAHLHETVPNTSGVARYSIDFRTFDRDDLCCGIGAPNVDGRSTGGRTKLTEYLRCSDLEPHPASFDDRFEPT